AIARLMRGEVLRLRGTDLAVSARALGASPAWILGRHLVPAGLGPVIVSAAFGAGTAVVAEASLSFLGLGVQPPAPTWGQMLSIAASRGAGNWWMLIFPGGMVALTVAGFNLLGEGLRRRYRV
ncbi:MAG TPA: ABC transporter permease, partial [Candidatus Polarisedimenticolia bacterium]|nr:ABC transporter permease [Candidatus Polarisedimenticolia bacterium]